MTDFINILGINISTLNREATLNKISGFLSDQKQHQIITPNPEIILTAQHDEEYFYILNKADLAIPDGIGLKFAAWVLGKNVSRITGVELTEYLLKYAEENNYKIAVLALKNGLSSKKDIEEYLKNYHKNLKFLVAEINKNSSVDKIKKLNSFCPSIVFCGLGAPSQDKFIFHNLKKISSAKIGIGIGGTFDYFTGKIKQPPKLFKILGFEWLWRLLKILSFTNRKNRIARITNAVIKFPLLYISWRFIRPFFYRPNVSCILFKKENNIFKILVVERQEEENHWQLPQGGTDGLDLKTAGIKELTEELGCEKIKPIKTFPNLHKYTFKNYQRSNYRGGDTQKHTDYKGQKQGLLIAEFQGKDEEIKINFWDHSRWKWVNSDELVNTVYSDRKEATTKFINKFNNLKNNL